MPSFIAVQYKWFSAWGAKNGTLRYVRLRYGPVGCGGFGELIFCQRACVAWVRACVHACVRAAQQAVGRGWGRGQGGGLCSCCVLVQCLLREHDGGDGMALSLRGRGGGGHLELRVGRVCARGTWENA